MSPISRSCLVTHRPMSVEPASSSACRMVGAHLRQLVERARGEEGFAAGAVGGHGVAPQCGQLGGQRGAVEFDARQFAHAARGVDDRPVAGAAAQVAGQGVVDLAAARLPAVLFQVHAPQRHDEAGRAEAALGTVAFDHRLLHRMQGAVGLLQVFDREQRLAVERGGELDAGVDRLQRQLAILERADDDRAGAAVAFGAAFLGAGAVQILAQMLQDGAGRRHVADLVELALIIETDWF